jgi:hypothetical protein
VVADAAALLLLVVSVPVWAHVVGLVLASGVAVVLWSLVRRNYNLRQAQTGHLTPKRTKVLLVAAIAVSIVIGSFHILAGVIGVGL